MAISWRVETCTVLTLTTQGQVVIPYTDDTGAGSDPCVFCAGDVFVY